MTIAGSSLIVACRMENGGTAVSFATMMVHVDVEPISDARIRLAARLADRFASTLIGISACILPPYPAEGAYFVIQEFVEQERRGIVASLKGAEAAFRAAAASNHVKLEWRSEIALPDDYVVSEARAADLLIVGRQSSRDVCRSLDSGAAVLRTGRPILAVPRGIDVPKAERIVIGWKESREARRALQDSLPLLHEAKSVSIAAVCDEDTEALTRRQIEDVVQYLARHRISATAITSRPKGSIASELVHLAQAENADLIITGAYGHSRLGEWMFGGVTRDLLTSSPICCLLAN
jgi:nucleotide-binding universal stress UspA family protein